MQDFHTDAARPDLYRVRVWKQLALSGHLRAGRLTLCCLPLSGMHFLLSGNTEGVQEMARITGLNWQDNSPAISTIFIKDKRFRFCWDCVRGVLTQLPVTPQQPEKNSYIMFCVVAEELCQVWENYIWVSRLGLQILTKKKRKGAVTCRKVRKCIMIKMCTNTFFLYITDPFGKPWICGVFSSNFLSESLCY